MKNAADRKAFIENPENWHVVELTKNTRVSAIRYKGEERYRLEVYEIITNFDYEKRVHIRRPEWNVRDYYKKNPNYFGALERQSVTQIREWVADQDRKGGKE